MALHLQQEAWLGAHPSGFSSSRRVWIARHKGQSRADQYSVDPGPLSWLSDLLWDAGGCVLEQGGMGAYYRPLNWADIVAWISGAERSDVTPFWRRRVMELSRVLASAATNSMKPEHPAPYQPHD